MKFSDLHKSNSSNFVTNVSAYLSITITYLIVLFVIIGVVDAFHKHFAIVYKVGKSWFN